MSTNQILIIAGFRKTGKSYCAEKLPGIVIDLKSSDYQYIYDADGNKFKHPEWPVNYVKAIRSIAFESQASKEYKDVIYVCIDTEPDLLDILDTEDIPYTIIIPPIEQRDEIIKHYMPEFADTFNTAFDIVIKSLEARPVQKIKLLKDQYLFDLLNNPNFYWELFDSIYKS